MKILRKLAARTQNASAHAPVMIAFLGDSVTHGCFEIAIDRSGQIDTIYDADSGYPYRLKRRLEEMYPAGAVSILNAGVSGGKAAGGLERLERDVLSRRPDLVVIAFGLNDSMNPDVQAGLDAYVHALQGMIQAVLANGAECIVLTPNHMCSYVAPALKDAELRSIAAEAAQVQARGILARYADAARRTAARMHVPVADAAAIWDAMASHGVDTTALLANHINHPTRSAHDIFVSVLLNTMLADQGEMDHEQIEG